MALGLDRSLYLTGAAEAGFNTTPGTFRAAGGPGCYAFSASPIKCADGFAARIANDGSHLIFATYLGGSSVDNAYAIAVAPDGGAYVGGETLSSDFPVTSNAFQGTYGGTVAIGSAVYGHGFLTRLGPSGSLLYSTYFGGTGADTVEALTVEPDGNVLLTGHTESLDLPVTANAAQPYYGGAGDAFVARFNPTGGATYISYLGSGSVDRGVAADVSTDGRIYISVDGQGLAGALQGQTPTACDGNSNLIELDRKSLHPVRAVELRWAPEGGASVLALAGGIVYAAALADRLGAPSYFAVPTLAPAGDRPALSSLLLNRINFNAG